MPLQTRGRLLPAGHDHPTANRSPRPATHRPGRDRSTGRSSPPRRSCPRERHTGVGLRPAQRHAGVTPGAGGGNSPFPALGSATLQGNAGAPQGGCSGDPAALAAFSASPATLQTEMSQRAPRSLHRGATRQSRATKPRRFSSRAGRRRRSVWRDDPGPGAQFRPRSPPTLTRIDATERRSRQPQSRARGDDVVHGANASWSPMTMRTSPSLCASLPDQAGLRVRPGLRWLAGPGALKSASTTRRVDVMIPPMDADRA